MHLATVQDGTPLFAAGSTAVFGVAEGNKSRIAEVLMSPHEHSSSGNFSFAKAYVDLPNGEVLGVMYVDVKQSHDVTTVRIKDTYGNQAIYVNGELKERRPAERRSERRDNDSMVEGAPVMAINAVAKLDSTSPAVIENVMWGFSKPCWPSISCNLLGVFTCALECGAFAVVSPPAGVICNVICWTTFTYICDFGCR